MRPEKSLYLDGTDLERGNEAFMRFRLTYNGPLLSSNPLSTDGMEDSKQKERRERQILRRLAHKHCLRRHFHKQLKAYWESHPFLSTHCMDSASMPLLPPAAGMVWGASAQAKPMNEVLAAVYGDHGYGFVPLVRKEISLACSLRILCLRRDGPSAVMSGRDIDNRVKTLLDALTIVKHTDGVPLGEDLKPLAPGADEKPFFYCLLDDDRQVTHLEVETDNALEPNPTNPKDEDYVRMVVSVEIRPINVTMFNLSFA